MLAGAGERDVVAGVGVAHDAGGGVVPEDAGEAGVGFRGAVATMTMPACWEKPMPTPPPWWSETQVAPLAQFRSAFRSGQSETASEPSAIASVSRLGLATRAASRGGRGR